MSYITTNILRTNDYSDAWTHTLTTAAEKIKANATPSGPTFTFCDVADNERSRRQYGAVRHALDAIGARYAVVTRDETTDAGTTVETVVLVAPTVPGMVRLLSMCASYRESYETTRYWSDATDYYRAGTVGPEWTCEEYTIEIVGMSRARLAVIETASGIRIV